VNRPGERAFVWLGGAAFVTALAFCAYSYLVTFSSGVGTSAAHGSNPLDTLRLAANVALFSLFAAHHSLFARDSVKARLAQIVPDRLMRSVYVWTASLLLIFVCALWLPIGRDVYEVTGWQADVHAAVQLAGLAIIAASVRTIDALELAGIRRDASRADLQVTGPYRWVRHPLYLGWMAAVFGAAHMTVDRLAFAAITSAYLIVAIPWEERALERAFPESYRRYKGQVRWRVVPYVY
jgi:protein-S-isoprenylcysteine O-methyltransferase Ste14